MVKFSVFSNNPITMLRKLQMRMLIKSGLTLGQNVFVDENVSFDSSFCWLISIGDECTLSKHVIILAHDASTKKHLGYTKIGRVRIGKKTFVGAGSIILPGVTIGNNVIIGAGSVVTHDIPNNSVAVGNPARIIKTTTEYIKTQEKNLATRPTYSKKGWTGKSTNSQKKKIMKEQLSKGIGYIE
jgi:maltose O-acetyltransferase